MTSGARSSRRHLSFLQVRGKVELNSRLKIGVGRRPLGAVDEGPVSTSRGPSFFVPDVRGFLDAGMAGAKFELKYIK